MAMKKHVWTESLVKGQKVLVSHLQGEEEGEIESINLKTGKVLVFFNYLDCPHFDSFNLNQVRPLRPTILK